MLAMFAHLTPLEAPVLWFTFFAGTAVGAAVAWFLLRRRAAGRG